MPAEWVSSLVTVQKPNGRIRLCIDLQPLNKALKRNNYPMHTIEELLPELSNGKCFSVMDVKNGYWHLELDSQSSQATAFNTPLGMYKWKRLPFGIATAPELFQKHLDESLHRLQGTYTIADDILIVGTGQTNKDARRDHDRKVIQLLDRCRQKESS